MKRPTVLVMVVVTISACGDSPPPTAAVDVNDSPPPTVAVDVNATHAAAIASVAPFITDNPYAVTTAGLAVIDNPRGAGQIVYVPEVQKRLGQPVVNLLWVVLGDQAYAVNGTSKNVTPDLPWPRDAPDAAWETSGLNRFVATETIAIVFGQD